ncbi:MAG: type IX secretion system plug protein domain-containing protein [Bacteroidota bacterium]
MALASVGCSGSSEVIKKREVPFNPLNAYLPPSQVPAPQSIKTIQFFRTGYPEAPPIIRLNRSDDRLTLKFDELSVVGGQFYLTFTHHNKDWSVSNLPFDLYQAGFFELNLVGSIRNKINRPEYFSYEISFPNKDVRFLTSGNFMAHIHDFQTGKILFSLPFFVIEDVGEMDAFVETIFNIGRNGGAIHQPFGIYEYPDFIDFPQVDLSYSFIQNRFWGKAKNMFRFDFSNPGQINFHLSRDQAFQGNFDFIDLNISRLDLSNPQVENWVPDPDLPRLRLLEDLLNFKTIRNRSTLVTGIYEPVDGRSSQYAQVTFALNTGRFTPEDKSYYLVGDFNQWRPGTADKLRFNSETSNWETQALLKQGRYAYTYVEQVGNELNEFILSDDLTSRRQEYTAFVYYFDPEFNYHRLLKALIFNSEE